MRLVSTQFAFYGSRRASCADWEVNQKARGRSISLSLLPPRKGAPIPKTNSERQPIAKPWGPAGGIAASSTRRVDRTNAVRGETKRRNVEISCEFGIGIGLRLRLCYHNGVLSETTSGTAVDILVGSEHSNAFFMVPFLVFRRSRS